MLQVGWLWLLWMVLACFRLPAATGQGPTTFRKIGDGACRSCRDGPDWKHPSLHHKYDANAKNGRTWCEAYCVEQGPACVAYHYRVLNPYCEVFGSKLSRTPQDGWKYYPGNGGMDSISTVFPFKYNDIVCYAKAPIKSVAARCYTHVEKGCVNGDNIKLYPGKTVAQCQALCDADTQCKAFELRC